MRNRTDSNQKAIVDALRALGCSVAILSGVGGGVPDLLVGYQGVNYLLEVKNLAGRGMRLTPAESAWLRDWRGQVNVVASLDEALAVVRAASHLGGKYAGAKPRLT
jgi:hypothetical protein